MSGLISLEPLDKERRTRFPKLADRPCVICERTFTPQNNGSKQCGRAACRRAMILRRDSVRHRCERDRKRHRWNVVRVPETGAPLCPVHKKALIFGTDGNGLAVQACIQCPEFTRVPRRSA